jgi:hypothetical protein
MRCGDPCSWLIGGRSCVEQSQQRRSTRAFNDQLEQTDASGYYRGARYHGAIQILAEPTGRRMTGKWVGFGKQMDINTGPWELVFQDASTNKATLDKYNRLP